LLLSRSLFFLSPSVVLSVTFPPLPTLPYTILVNQQIQAGLPVKQLT